MNTTQIPRPLHYLIVVCASVMLFIWGLPHTIALRNVMMFLGAIGSVYFFIRYRPIIMNRQALPLLLIYLLPLWVIIHYCFFAQEPDLQLIELKSLWVRVFAGMLIATAMGVLIRKSDRINSLFVFAFFGMSVSVVSLWVFHSWRLHYLISPAEFLQNFIFDRVKYTTAFFSIVDLAVGCASLTTLFFGKLVTYRFRKSLLILSLMLVSIYAPVLANSKNGVGIGAILMSLLMGTIFISLLRNKDQSRFEDKNRRYFGWFLLGITTILLSTVIAVHKDKANIGWDTLLSDIQVSVQIDKYQAWRGPIASNGESYPIAAVNTYERFAWMTAGAREFVKHPLGYGLINQISFPRWLKKDGIAFDSLSSTHSGWLDIGLAFGYPGLFILFFSIALIIKQYLSKTKKSFTSYLALWLTLAVFLAGILQEIASKHTLEAMIFFLTLSTTCLSSAIKEDKYENYNKS